MESQLLEPPRETKQLVRESEEFEKSGIKLQCLTEERETFFDSSYRDGREIEGLRLKSGFN